jgi:hypothetical protein
MHGALRGLMVPTQTEGLPGSLGVTSTTVMVALGCSDGGEYVPEAKSGPGREHVLDRDVPPPADPHRVRQVAVSEPGPDGARRAPREHRGPTSTPQMDPVNASDPLGLFCLGLCSFTEAGHDVASGFDTVRHAVATNDVINSSAYTWFNEHLNPAYFTLMAYYDEAQAAENGCGLFTEAKYGAEGTLGLVSTGAAAAGIEQVGKCHHRGAGHRHYRSHDGRGS